MTADQQQISRMLEDFKARFQLKYGIELDDWSAANLVESQQRSDALNQRLEASMKQNKLLYDRFKGSIKTVQFNSKLEAFVYALGIGFPYAFALALAVILGFLFFTSNQKYQQISAVVARYENLEAYENLISQGKLKKENGLQYLILKQPKSKGENLFGQFYQYDAKANVVKVPLRNLK